MRIIKHLSLLVLFLMLFASTTAQRPLAVSTTDNDYYRALELFDKEKYSAAIELFDRYIEDFGNNLDGTVSYAEYCAAISSVRLYSRDAEYRINKFVRNFHTV